MANQCGREPRRRRRLILFSAGVDSPRGKLPNFRAQCRLWRVFSDAFSAAFFHSDRTETTRGKEVGRRCCFETVGSVVALPESTPAGLGKTGIGEDIARRGHFGSIAIAFSCADFSSAPVCLLVRGYGHSTRARIPLNWLANVAFRPPARVSPRGKT